MKKTLFLAILLSLFFAGCATKRQYFEALDDNITAEIPFSASLNDDTKFVNSVAASLENGEGISKKGEISALNLAKDEIFLGEFDRKFTITSQNGKIKILNADKSVIMEQDLGKIAVSANILGDYLAVLSDENRAFLIKISTGEILLTQKFDPAYAYDSRVASPVFIDSIVVFPTLDGQIAIADLNLNRFIRNLVISNQPFFNNLINLTPKGENLYATTNSRITLITPFGNKVYNAEIKNILFHNDKIFLFLKDGVIKSLDLNLNEISSKKFTFAIFLDALIKDGSLYVLEKTGFLIKTDLNLKNEKIYELNGEIDEKTFSDGVKFYIGDKILNIGNE